MITTITKNFQQQLLFVISKMGAENIKRNILRWVELNNIEQPWILLDNTIKLEILRNES